MMSAALIAILVTMLLALVRALLGPTVYDRILAVNAFGTATVIFIPLIGFVMGRPEFIDIALVYALINFVGTIAIMKYFEFGSLGYSESDNPTKDDSAQ